MIVKHSQEGWEIISHYTHGLLSGKIASHLEVELMPEHWIDVLTGIIEHDDHLLDFDEQDYLTENGSPKDFSMQGSTNKEALEHAKRVFENAMQKSQLIALLIGRHLTFLYETLAQDYKPMAKFLKKIDFLRTSQRKLYELDRKDEEYLYNIMLFSDRCSLILCQGVIPEVERKLEINKTINDQRFFIRKKSNDNLTVEPWPFRADNFCVQFEYRVLKEPTFKNNEHLKKALKEASIQMCTYTLEK